MKISIIAAISTNNVIGFEGKIPWRLKNDMVFFKNTTMGGAIIMGRKTWDSLPIKPLPGRKNIIVSVNNHDAIMKDYATAGVLVAKDCFDALNLAKDSTNVFFIGGQKIYEASMRFADTMYLTRVKATVPGDAVFPNINRREWEMVDKQEFKADDKNEYDHDIITCRRI